MSVAPPLELPTAEYRNFIFDSRRWQGFEHRPGDILVCTPPKCGTTWTQMIVAMLLFQDGEFPAPVVEMAPWLDARFNPRDETLATLTAQTQRRSIKTHTPADGIPWWDDAYYIVVGRDGRDAFMSFVNHVASMRLDVVAELIQSAIAEGIPMEAGMPPEDLHEFFAVWIEEGLLFQFLTTYWERRHQPNVLFVHYDDLKANLEGGIRRIARFLAIDLDESRVPLILERCSFAWMKANSDRIGDFGSLFSGGGQSFFHRGTNGRWQSVLTPEELATYERISRERMAPDLKAWLDRS